MASAFRSRNFPVLTRTFQQIAGYLQSTSAQQNFVGLYVWDKPGLSNATRRTKQTRQLGPGSVDFAHVLHSTHGANDPPDVLRNRYHPQLCTMAIGSPTEFLHNLG